MSETRHYLRISEDGAVLAYICHVVGAPTEPVDLDGAFFHVDVTDLQATKEAPWEWHTAKIAKKDAKAKDKAAAKATLAALKVAAL